MAKKAEDLSGHTYGFLKVISMAPDRISRSGRKIRMWECECLLCGKHKTASADDLRRGFVKSCGCLAAHNGKIRRNKKICVICGKEFACSPSAQIVTCSPACHALYNSQNHKGLKRTAEVKTKLSKIRLENEKCAELQAAATEAAKNSPKAGKFETNIHAIDWHLIGPDGRHYYFHSLNFWLRENCRELFGFEPDGREFSNAVSGLSRAKRSLLGRLPRGQRPGYTYKGWTVVPTDDDFRQ